jgi:hypothetical protein
MPIIADERIEAQRDTQTKLPASYHAYAQSGMNVSMLMVRPSNDTKNPTEALDTYTVSRYVATDRSMNPDEEDKIVEAMEQLRINYNLRQWRVCSLLCESLADKFKSVAEQNDRSSK